MKENKQQDLRWTEETDADVSRLLAKRSSTVLKRISDPTPVPLSDAQLRLFLRSLAEEHHLQMEELGTSSWDDNKSMAIRMKHYDVMFQSVGSADERFFVLTTYGRSRYGGYSTILRFGQNVSAECLADTLTTLDRRMPSLMRKAQSEAIESRKAERMETIFATTVQSMLQSMLSGVQADYSLRKRQQHKQRHYDLTITMKDGMTSVFRLDDTNFAQLIPAIAQFARQVNGLADMIGAPFSISRRRR